MLEMICNIECSSIYEVFTYMLENWIHFSDQFAFVHYINFEEHSAFMLFIASLY